jgi:hypothetical protein
MGSGGASKFHRTLKLNHFYLPPAFQLGARKMEADASITPSLSRLPSIVLEVGDSGSITQLKTDAMHWIEDADEVGKPLHSL